MVGVSVEEGRKGLVRLRRDKACRRVVDGGRASLYVGGIVVPRDYPLGRLYPDHATGHHQGVPVTVKAGKWNFGLDGNRDRPIQLLGAGPWFRDIEPWQV